MSDRIQVQVHVDGETAPTQAGTAYFHWRAGSVTTSFTYEPSWLADPAAYPLDPDLPLSSGSHHVDRIPGAFSDCSPDRWGRNLIARGARAESRQAHGAAPSLSDVDYLLRVSDTSRQGALRFRVGDGAFLSPSADVPKMIELPKLLRSADVVARSETDGGAYEAVKVLLDAGTGSLGGARPKATVQGDDGRLMLAKFPHHQDRWDVSAWEKTALDLAAMAAISVPERELVRLDPTALLLDRFDRGPGGTRIAYISAMTLVSGRDGEPFDYEDVAAHLEEDGAGDTVELERLFRRVVFNVAINNTDDHLRNLGFLRAPDGWRLSPAFDINPNPDPGARRQTTIGGAERPEDAPKA